MADMGELRLLYRHGRNHNFAGMACWPQGRAKRDLLSVMANRISVRDVDFRYSSLAFRERSLKEFLGRTLSFKRSRPQLHDVVALKSVSVEIHAGERVGLMGHNGAGKSTFLRMIAGLYPIARGTRVVEGTVRSLFELSLGFEPDATGRENILYR